MEAGFEELVEGFVTGRVGISASLMSVPLCAALSVNLMGLSNDGLMAAAGIGNARTRSSSLSIRSDKTSWLEAGTTNLAEMEFLDIMDRFMSYLNRHCYTGLNACEFHYALYEEGAFYGRHKDQFRSNTHRKFSVISYLNEAWTTGNGGQLIIHHAGEASQSIEPATGTTVFFQSDMLEHEVIKANRPRLSVTGWLKRV